MIFIQNQKIQKKLETLTPQINLLLDSIKENLVFTENNVEFSDENSEHNDIGNMEDSKENILVGNEELVNNLDDNILKLLTEKLIEEVRSIIY